MNRVTIIWSAASGACLMLALMHLLVWCGNRRSWVNLCFSVTTLGVMGLMTGELMAMHAETPEAFGLVVRWSHLVYGVGVFGSLGFVHFYFGTSRLWLLLLALVARLMAVVMNFATGVNLHLSAIHSLAKMRFLGEEVSILGEWVTNPWVRLGQLAALVQLVYVVDASMRLWRSGRRDSRNRALVVGGGLAFFIVFASGQAGLVVEGVLRMPIIASMPFLCVVLAMGYKLSRDGLRAAQLASDLHESEERMTLATDAANLGIWIHDLAQNEIWATEQWRGLFGFGSSQRLDIATVLQRIHPEDREAVRQMRAGAIKAGASYETEYRVVHPDGQTHWISSRGRVELNATGKPILLRGVSIDITARKRADQKMRESEQRLNHALEATSEGVWDWEIKTGAVFFSPHWCQLLGYEPAEVPGHVEFFFTIVHPDDVAIVKRELEDHLAGTKPVKETETRLRMKSGEFRWFLDQGRVVEWDESGQPTRMVGRIADITDRKLADAETQNLRAELTHLSRISVLGELAGTLAHELNQPLAAMLSNSQVGQRSLLAGPPDLAEMAAIFGDIAADAKRAGGIIHGMRALFKKDVIVKTKPVDLNRAIRQVLNLLHSEILARKSRVEFNAAESLPSVKAVRVEIQQVLINLLINGLDAMKTGNGSSNEVATIEIGTAVDAGYITVTVRDHGPGIAPEVLDRLFEPFASTKPGGLGLGLSISRRIMERYGGRLEAENHAEGGAVFQMVLPVADV